MGWPVQVVSSVEYVTQMVDLSQPVEVRSLNPWENDQNDVAIVTTLGGISTIVMQVVYCILVTDPEGFGLCRVAHEEASGLRRLRGVWANRQPVRSRAGHSGQCGRGGGAS